MTFYTESDIRKDIKKSAQAHVKDGKIIVTRFPPEPSGHLHIGHAKAIFQNYGLAEFYGGRMLLRFDDTNPEKENMDCENSIINDLLTMGIDVSTISHTSDWFDCIQNKAEELIQKGYAYVDETPPEQMSQDRRNGIMSECRNNDIDKNIQKWKGMIQGTITNSVVRLKLNMKDNNFCMRDPSLYRCVSIPHHRTGDKYKVYPTYDFACPIVDSMEGVTHVMRSTEFEDRNGMYKLILKLLNLPPLELFTYGKVEFIDVEMSKRKIKAMINDGKVTGWDDPRLPTIKGILNNGLSLRGLKEFTKTLGFSKHVVEMHWDKIWGINRKIIDKIATRISYVDMNHVELEVENHSDELIEIPKFSQNQSLGMRPLHRNNKIVISKEDYDLCEDGEEITLMNWGNMFINKEKNTLVMNLEGDIKSTSKKLIWLSRDTCKKIEIYNYIIPIGEVAFTTEIILVDSYYDHIPNHEFVQILKKSYYVKKDDNILVEVNTGRK